MHELDNCTQHPDCITTAVCRKATVGKLDVEVGDLVQLAVPDGDGEESDAAAAISMGLVQAMWQTSSGVKRC
jgi:hypothetical protein